MNGMVVCFSRALMRGANDTRVSACCMCVWGGGGRGQWVVRVESDRQAAEQKGLVASAEWSRGGRAQVSEVCVNFLYLYVNNAILYSVFNCHPSTVYMITFPKKSSFTCIYYVHLEFNYLCIRPIYYERPDCCTVEKFLKL